MAQDFINSHSKTFSLTGDTIFLDSLSVVQNSLQFFDAENNEIKDIEYTFDFEKSCIVITGDYNLDEITISYRTFPINFFEPVTLFDKDDFLVGDTNDNNPYEYVFNREDYKSNFSQSSLSRKGSISRGISFGNNQDVIVNSSLNLQLDGKLNDELFIKAAISDNNIPIQPDGTSQQLQEFDKVYIQLYNDRISVIAGDFELKRPRGYHLNYFKKAQGASVAFNNSFTNKNDRDIFVETSVSGAVAKGKLRRQEIKGIEGNQGPYKLSGNNNETYIVVLAGTEKVYIDGILMSRGTENDYIIDYNLGEVTFTASQPINKDKRIVVEFEYSDRNYTRFLVATSSTIRIDSTEFWLNIYDESDNKNSPFDQTITSDNRMLLGEIGDNLDQAIIPGYDSLGFDAAEIRYALVDTLVDGMIYDSVFVYSTNPEAGFYRISFSLVGENNGNYIKGISAANGRVYEWLAPIDGVPQGNYAPLKQIITPKKNQVVTFGGASKIGKSTSLDFELAYSNNDVNTFSKFDSEDDQAYAMKFNVNQKIAGNKISYLGANVSYGFLQKNFNAVENFRETEFTRDWNLESIYPVSSENLIKGEVLYLNKNIGNTSLSSAYINRGSEYLGLQNRFQTNLKVNSWTIAGNASLLNSDNSLYSTEFLRHNLLVSKDFKFLKLGIKEIAENNQWRNQVDDSLALNSFNFSQYEAFIATGDSLKNKVSVNYKYREDALPFENNLKNATTSQDLSFTTEFLRNPDHRFKTIFNYRSLEVNDTSLYENESENNMTGKAEYTFRLFKGIISSSTFYEIGSGLERKTEFSYIEVAPGQGVFAWTDYNDNGVQELDEFEVANFVDQASFIRILIPTTDYIKTYSNQFNQSLKINPELRWRSKTGIRKVLSRFSNQFAYRIAQKNTSSDLLEFANPFVRSVDETALVSLNSSFRNSFSFNRGKPKFGVDYVVQSNNNKLLLVSGFDTRTNFTHNVLLRYNITKSFGFQNSIGMGMKRYNSEFFSNKNYEIENQFNEFQMNYQPNLNNRLSVKYIYKSKKNIAGEENLYVNDIGLEYRLSSVKKGSFSTSFNYIHYAYNAETNSAIAYEMLQGFMPGTNLTWSVNFQRQLSNGLQINLNYNARKSSDTDIIHTGGVQLRAFF